MIINREYEQEIDLRDLFFSSAVSLAEHIGGSADRRDPAGHLSVL
jgi:hypothetical protein